MSILHVAINEYTHLEATICDDLIGIKIIGYKKNTNEIEIEQEITFVPEELDAFVRLVNLLPNLSNEFDAMWSPIDETD
jgi:hypothetical protein